MENIEQIISDTLLQRPLSFKLADERIYFYQPTLGLTFLTGSLIKALDINFKVLNVNVSVEVLRLLYEKKEICLRLLALHSMNGKECLDNGAVEERIEFLRDNLLMEDAAAIMIQILTPLPISDIQKELGITDELEQLKKAQNAKKADSTMTYGGVTIWGTMVDVLAEKYGWTLDYILWGISYANIQMLLSDSIKTVFLSADEKRAANIYKKSEVLDGNDPEVWKKLKNFHWD